MASNNNGEIRDGALVDKASVEFTRIVSACVLGFYDCLCGKDRKAKLEAEIKVMFENKYQMRANMGVKEILDQENIQILMTEYGMLSCQKCKSQSSR